MMARGAHFAHFLAQCINTCCYTLFRNQSC